MIIFIQHCNEILWMTCVCLSAGHALDDNLMGAGEGGVFIADTLLLFLVIRQVFPRVGGHLQGTEGQTYVITKALISSFSWTAI